MKKKIVGIELDIVNLKNKERGTIACVSGENDAHIVKNKKFKLCEGTFSRNPDFEQILPEQSILSFQESWLYV